MWIMVVFVFSGFQMLDFFGFMEMLVGFFDEIDLVIVGIDIDFVLSRYGQKILLDCGIGVGNIYDLLFVSGGDVVLDFVKDFKVMDWLCVVLGNVERVMGVCIGIVLFGMVGVLDGKWVMMNKFDFIVIVLLVLNVDWVK